MARITTRFLLVYRVERGRDRDEPILKRKVNNSPNSGLGLLRGLEVDH